MLYMAEVIIVQEIKILVDDDWIEYVRKHKWRIQGRDKSVMRTRLTSEPKGVRNIRLAREIMGLTVDDGMEVDHINRNTLDNRRENLRVVSPMKNQWNAGVRVDNKWGYRGVYWNMISFQYQLKCNKKMYQKSGFKTPEEAARARDRKALELYGNFAFTNFPKEDYGYAGDDGERQLPINPKRERETESTST